MAFIVPVVRKDFNIYGPRRTTPTLIKSVRSNSTPVTVPVRIVSIESLERSLARQAAKNRRVRQESTTSSSAQGSPALAENGRNNRRISIKHLTSTDSSESNTTTDSGKRRVRFGFCEEIAFDTDEDPDESQKRAIPQIRRGCSLPEEKTSTEKTSRGVRSKSVPLIDIEPTNFNNRREPSTLATILRVARLVRPGN